VRFTDGVIPVVVQESASGDVLMLAFMNAEALQLTRETGLAHYWSRSRNVLWKKGGTSGHVQHVDEIRVNCERNSLLLQVRQEGAVCHDGFATCFYRRVEPDGSLTVVRERSFDPADVYGGNDRLTAATRMQFGAYAFLRDNALDTISGTSERLRGPATRLHGRLAGELRELAGVLEGSHRHDDPVSDLRLEASQVVYWLLLCCLRGDLAWERLRPDRALSGADSASESPLVQRLHAEADQWERDAIADGEMTSLAQHTLSLVSEACQSGGVDPLTVVESDLRDLVARPYLQPYFAQAQH
jgi:phosphoribosyl-AMP cyclohydrolase